jgi:hypothetical protein
MAQASDVQGKHVLALYRSSDRADAALRSLCERASRVTVLVLARQEPERSGCCDTRSVLWNGVCRDLAQEQLGRAMAAVDDRATFGFHMLVAPDSDAVRALAREALAREADEIVLADRRGSGLGPLERRRLRRISGVPVRP